MMKNGEPALLDFIKCDPTVEKWVVVINEAPYYDA